MSNLTELTCVEIVADFCALAIILSSLLESSCLRHPGHKCVSERAIALCGSGWLPELVFSIVSVRNRNDDLSCNVMQLSR